MSYFNLKLSFYSNGETCACCQIPSSLYFYKTYEFTPKRASIFSSKLKPDGREFYSIEVRDVTSGYKKEITFFEDGINTDIIFRVCLKTNVNKKMSISRMLRHLSFVNCLNN